MIQNGNNDIVIILDQDLRFFSLNDFALDILEYNENELINENFIKIFSQKSNQKLIEKFLLEKQRPASLNAILVSKSGLLIFANIKASTIKIGNKVFFILIAELLYDLLSTNNFLNDVYPFVVVNNTLQQIVYINRLFEVTFLYNIEDIRTSDDAKIQFIDTNFEALILNNFLLENNNINDSFATVNDKNNKNHTVLISNKIIKFCNNELSIYTFKDVTTYYKHYSNSIKENELLFHITNSSDELIWAVSLPDFQTVYLNNAVENIYMRKREEFFNDTNLWYKSIYKEDRDLVKEILNSIRDCDGGDIVCKHRIVRPDGDIRWIENHLSFWKGNINRPDYIHGIATDITKKEEDGNLLENQTALLTSLIDSLPDIVFAKSLNGIYLRCNKEFEKFNNRDSASIIGCTDFEIFNTSIAEKFIEQDKTVILTGKPLVFEENIITSENNSKILLTTKSPVFNSNKKIIGIIGVSRDITKKRIIEKALFDSENKYRMVVDNLKEVVFRTDADGFWTFLNPAWEEITGFTVEESLNKLFFNYIHPDDREKNRLLFIPLINKEKPYCRHEIRYLTKTGKFKWIDVFARLILDNNGNIIGTAGTLNDVTNRKDMEEKIFNLNSLHSLLNEISSLLIQSNLSQFSNSLNNSLKMLGLYSKVDRVYIFEFNYTTNTMSNTYEWCAPGIKAEINNLQNISNNILPHWFEKFKNNEYVYIPRVSEIEDKYAEEKEILEQQGIISLLTIPIFYVEKLIGFIGFDSVVTERVWEIEYISLLKLAGEIISGTLYRKKFETEIMEAKEAFEIANAAKSEFIANMSHEIRSPMNAILGFSEILLNSTENPRDKNYLSTILNSGKTLLALINDILDLSKIESGKLEIRTEPVNLFSLLAEIEQMFAFNINEKGINFYLENNFDKNLHFLLDEVRLRQILFNLIGNAIKFTDKGFVKVATEFVINDIEPESGTINIRVQDSGIGIAEEDFELIFESFGQVTNGETKKYGGTGLGLTITKRLINLMNGEIFVISSLGKGTIFVISIFDVKISHSRSTSSNSFEWLDDNIEFYNQKILVIDDMLINRELVSSYLATFKLQIYEASSGSEGIEKAQNIKPDFILMDIRMPDIDGNIAAKTINSLPELAFIPIVAFTASAKKDEELMANNFFKSILRKPITKFTLINELKKYLKFEAKRIDKNNDINENIKTSNLELKFDKDFIKDFEATLLNSIFQLKEIVDINELNNFIVNFEKMTKNYKITKFDIYIIRLKSALDSYDFEEISNILNNILNVFENSK
ncbi:MAG: PAS domain S-box protein [bacterium]